MHSASSNLPALLVISGIDLLLAALCAAIGMLVLLIGSSNATERVVSDSVERLSDWSLLIVVPGNSLTPPLTCDGSVVTPQAINGTEGYVVRMRNDREWQCLLECDGSQGTAVHFATAIADETSTEEFTCSSGTIEVNRRGIKRPSAPSPPR